MRVLSLGAGVQSTTVALLAARGDIQVPDAAIFADTGWEPKAVYAHLEWLRGQLPFPVHIVSNGNIRDNILARRTAGGGRFAAIPWFIKTLIPAGTRVPIFGEPGEVIGERVLEKDEWKNGMGRRQCTFEHKLKPIMWKTREMLGKDRRARIAPGSAEVLIGISTDEAWRMKPAQQMWMQNRWPLIDLGMSRRDCLRWLKERQYPEPPKSSCIGCPFHNNAMWRDMRENSPEEWADAVAVDKALREGDARGFRVTEYMHAQRVPLDEVDLDRGKDKAQPDLFLNECEGICGV